MSDLDDDDALGQTALTMVDVEDLDGPLSGHLQLAVVGSKLFLVRPLAHGATVSIGRSSRCDVTIDDVSISRRHAVLRVGSTVTIEDVGSANGVRVHGTRISANQPTKIEIGQPFGIGTLTVLLQPRSVRQRRVWSAEDFRVRLAEECARADRSGGAFAVVLLRSDGASAASTRVEDVLDDALRESDVVGSNAATNEYEVLLVDTPPASAAEVTRRLDSKLAERSIRAQLTVACCPRDGQTPQQLVERLRGPAPVAAAAPTDDIVVADDQMQGLHRMVQQVGGSKLGVLLLGETGVGKEVFARAVHRASPRAAGAFVEINCAALTESLLESELFGHEKGAFTSATSAKPGLIESADGGTLFLDEIGDMPLSTQVKLLRVIESSQLRRVGALKPRTFDVRFVAATNSDIEAQVASGAFRRDLFFRLNGVTIMIPPLRERLAELEPLAAMFVRAAATTQPLPVISGDALELLRSYSWPGNVRELKHMMERAVLLCGGAVIEPEHFPVEKMRAVPPPAPASSEHVETAEIPRVRSIPKQDEEQAIIQALDRAGGNQTAAARLLGMSRRTLVNRLNDYTSVHRPRKTKQ